MNSNIKCDVYWTSHSKWLQSDYHYTTQGHCVPITSVLPLTWPDDHLINLTVQHFSSEQDRLCTLMFALTTDMMVLLLQCEAPDQMPHRRFKNNHSFMCKSFLKCYVSDFVIQPPPFALLVITLRPAHAQKHQFKLFTMSSGRKSVSWAKCDCHKLVWNAELNHLQA